jgi:hypothetical protein
VGVRQTWSEDRVFFALDVARNSCAFDSRLLAATVQDHSLITSVVGHDASPEVDPLLHTRLSTDEVAVPRAANGTPAISRTSPAGHADADVLRPDSAWLSTRRAVLRLATACH